MRMKMPPIKGDDASRFLATMLQSMQAKGCVDIGLIGSINAKNGTFFMQMVIIKRVGCGAGHGQLDFSSLSNSSGFFTIAAPSSIIFSIVSAAVASSPV